MITEAVVFDMDGVIFDSEKLICDIWAEYAQEIGLENIDEIILKCIGVNDSATRKIMYEAYGDDFAYDEHLKVISKRYHSIADNGKLPVKPGVFNLLDYLKSKNIKMAVASSTRVQTVTNQLTAAGFADYFDYIIGGDMVAKSKPEPDIFLEACRKLGANPAKSFVIEDSYNGIKAGVNAGMRPIMVPDLLPATDEMREKSFAVKKDLNEVKSLLETLL